MFIALEGIDGSAKTSSMGILANKLKAEGLTVATTRSLLPNTILGKATREWMSSDEVIDDIQITLVFLAAIKEANKTVSELLKTHDVVISDRWILSTMVYAPEATNEPSDRYNLIMDLIVGVSQTILAPDNLLYIDIIPEIAEARLKARDGVHDVFQGLDKQTIYRNRYIGILDGIEGISRISNNNTLEELEEQLSKYAGKITTVMRE